MHLRVFLSSPGDIVDERTLAQQTIDNLPKDPFLRDRLTCETVRWDDPAAPVAMPATLTPQAAVDLGLAKPSACDVVVVILWSRLGTPLPDSYRRADGTTYLSGTEWEYEEALAGQPPPHILVYRRTAKVAIDPDADDAAERLEQRRRVNRFFDRFNNPDGSLRGGYATYDSPQEFHDRLGADLRSYIERRLKGEQRPAPKSKAPPPYGDIARALKAGKVIPVIGGDVSRCGRPPGGAWDPDRPAFLPSGTELARFLADDTGFPGDADRDDLAKVASYYEAFQTRGPLKERLRQLLGPDGTGRLPLPSLYALLAEVPAPLLIVTTNVDNQLEQAFAAAGKAFDLVVYPADRKDLANAVLWWPHGAAEPDTPPPNALDVDLSRTTAIFKIHGAVRPATDEWDNFVVTEEDHLQLLARVAAAIPAQFAAHVRDRSLLFIGFSLHDWNLRLVMRSLARSFERRNAAFGDEPIPWWAIDEEVSEFELKLWEKRGVYPYRLAIDEFVLRLRERMGS